MRLQDIALWSFTLLLCGLDPIMAEDPIVVHYSDPSLVRLEKRLAITAAQRDRFEDIIVKYRDPLNSPATGNGPPSPDSPDQKHGRGGRSHNGSSVGPFGGGRHKIPRQELDELATILTSAQMKQFQELSAGKRK